MVDSRSLLTLALAVACIAAFGVAGSTFESSVQTSPDDAIDVDDNEWLPIGTDGARDIRQAVEAGDGDETGMAESGGGDSGDDGGTQPDQSGPKEEVGGGDGQDEAPGPGDGPATGPGEPSLFDSLLPYLLALLALLLALLVAALCYRYRDRIRAFLLLLFGGLLGDDDADGRSFRADSWGAIEPTNPVYRAWLRMVHQLDVDRPETMTAEECERAAVAAGMDERAVDSLGDAFREARYSGRPVTDDLCDRARESANRLGLGGAGADGTTGSGHPGRPGGRGGTA